MDQDVQELKPGEMVIKAKEFKLLPEGTPLQFHVDSTGLKEGTNYQTKKPETKLMIGFKLDNPPKGFEDEEGRVIVGMFNPYSLNAKSGLGKLAAAVLGEIPEQLDPAVDLVGKPLQMTLKNNQKEDSVFQNPDVFMRPTDDQTEVKSIDELVNADEVHPDDVPKTK